MSCSVEEALRRATILMPGSTMADRRTEARRVLTRVLGLEPAVLIAHPERTLSADEKDVFDRAVERRRKREPLSHIAGWREFWSLPFQVTKDTLIPRPETETVVEAALAEVAAHSAPLRLLDLGTGTGCILLALLAALPNATGLGVDISPAAVEVARDNAAALGLADRAAFAVGDWGKGLVGSFNLIVTNPPYVAAPDIEGLQPEVAQFEPRLALDGGPDGLDRYRELAPELQRLLAPLGRAVLEIGLDQAAAVIAILAGYGLALVGRRRDLAGIERCVVVTPAAGGNAA